MALDPLPRLAKAALKDFQAYLVAAPHEAFAVCAKGAYAWRTARDTTRKAIDTASSRCEGFAGTSCRLYAIDDEYAPQ